MRMSVWKASWLVLGVALAVSCTRFSFPQSPGSAPGRLTDRELMVKFESSTFSMGDPQGEPHEYPVHSVELSGFYMDRTEVTNDDYRVCVDEGICRATKEMSDPNLSRPTQPVVGATWADAVKYCGWVGKRLPTEAEWECAARGGAAARKYPFKGSVTAKKANVRGAADGFVYTSPVGSLPEGRSPEGLDDMAGNAAEWVSDWFSPTYYSESPDTDPKGPQVSTRLRSLRGGSWTGNAYEARSTSRGSMDPAYSKNAVGFRCAAGLK
jgi:formylglycine-generating enzyme required for sulfatase activity